MKLASHLTEATIKIAFLLAELYLINVTSFSRVHQQAAALLDLNGLFCRSSVTRLSAVSLAGLFR